MVTRTNGLILLLAGALATLTTTAPVHAAAATPATPVAPTVRAAAALTLGQTSAAAQACPDGGDHGIYAQMATLPAQPSYVVPSTGVITSFATYQGSTGSVRGLVLRPTAQANHFSVAGKSTPTQTGVNGLATVPTRIPVLAGDRLALQSVGSASWQCLIVAPAGNKVRLTLQSLFNPDTPGAVGDFSGGGQDQYLVNISASFEPDADGDGFGDVTQDQCPDSANLQTPCQRPETTLLGKVKKKTTKGFVTIKFSSSTPGASFTCQADKKPARACSSPFVGHYKTGKHTVTIAATDPTSALPDATPLVVRFKVVKKKPKS